MLEIQLMNKDHKDLKIIKDLYINTFPSNERRDFDDFLYMNPKSFEPCLFYDHDEFIGFAFLLTYKDITHILYLAIIEAKRCKGYGSSILHMVHHMKNGQRIIADVEREGQTYNDEQRLRRKEFYFRNGYHYSDVKYTWRDENYDVLIYNGSFTYDDFHDFWENVDSEARKA